MIGDCTSEDDERIASDIVDAAFQVHSRLGPGLLESAYEHCLHYEPQRRGHRVSRQLEVPLHYDQITLEVGFRVDLLVDNRIVIEVKSIEKLLPVHTAQLITYLKLLGLDLGFLINFNVPLIKQGLKRVVRFH